MSGRRVVAIFRRVVQEIRRDHRSVALLLVVPVVMTGLITFIVREGQSPAVDAVIVNPAGPPGAAVAAALGAALTEAGGSAAVVADEAAMRAAVEDGSASVGVLLPAQIGPGVAMTVTILTNGLDPAGESTQVAQVQRAWLAATATVTGVPIPTIERTTLYGVPSDDPMAPFA